MNKENHLFQMGIKAFNEERFYDAHEYWEELWLDYKLIDAKFIQGLIQLAVSYFHLFNNNINGSRSMIKKSLTKFIGFDIERKINVHKLIDIVTNVEKHLNEISGCPDFNKEYIIKINFINE